MVAVTVEALMDGSTDRAGVTITGLGVGDSLVSVWRLADGGREEVSGYRRVTMNDAYYFEDAACPVQRNVIYEVEVISGPLGASRTSSAPVLLPSTTGWLMDALVPQSAVRVVGKRESENDIYLRGDALGALARPADTALYKIMGTRKPMALVGQRQAITDLNTSVGLRSPEQNQQMQDLIDSTAQLIFRPLPEWGDLRLEGTMHLANANAVQIPVTAQIGGDITWWNLVSDVVAAPSIRPLTSNFTYGDVAMLMSTYQQKQDLMAGKTYLEDLKNPLGG